MIVDVELVCQYALRTLPEHKVALGPVLGQGRLTPTESRRLSGHIVGALLRRESRQLFVVR